MADALPKILLVEDRAEALELLEAYLSDSPYELRMASNGEEALRISQDWHPDVALLDVMMPRMSGYEVCRRLRADPATRDVGVIMVTALDQASDVDRALEVGTDDFLTKPVHRAELIARIEALLETRRSSGGVARFLDYVRAVENPGT